MKTIALIEIGNDGHREAYMRYFIAALLRLGCRVICLIPETDPIRRWVDAEFPGQAGQVVYRRIMFHRDRFARAGRWRERLNILANWYTARRAVEAAEREQGWTTDLVFFNFLDAYLINHTPHILLRALLGKRWSGIYFFPGFLRLKPALLRQAAERRHLDHMLTAPDCVAVGFHDEGIQQAFSERLGGKPVLFFPEIADLSDPDPDDPFRKQILELAQGRLVVGNIGLEKHKGNYELMRLARAADPQRFVFVFCGRDDGTLFDFLDAEQAAELRAFRDDLPANCLWHPAVFDEGAQYNAVLSAFDIVYMLYTHFYGASNRLTKAAHFRKRILADEPYCIGDAVRTYRLGETVRDTRTGSLLAALERLAQGSGPEPQWDAFLAANSTDRLQDRFRDLLQLL